MSARIRRRAASLARDRVRITIRGAQPERVLTACAEAGIEVSRAEPVEDFCSRATVSMNQVGRVRKIAGKYQCEVEVSAPKGLGRLARGGVRRWLLATLVAAACVCAWLSSLFIWEIRVVGNETVSSGEILRALDDCGVSVGTCWLDMNIDLVRSGVQLRVPELEWVTVNLHGSVAEVRVRERVEAPPVVDNDTPVELYAAESGVVVKMEVLQGQALVQRGDFVTAGQTLVSGAPQDIWGEARGVYAMGSVRVRTAYCLTAETPLTTAQLTPQGKKHTRWALIFGKKRVNFGKSSGISGAVCDKLNTEYVCAIPGLVRLPVSLVREQWTAVETTETSVAEKAARARLEQTLEQTVRDRIGADGEIVSANYTASKRDGMLVVTLRCECELEVARERPCEVINTPTEEFEPNDRTDD